MNTTEFGTLVELIKQLGVNIENNKQEQKRDHESQKQDFKDLRQEVKDGHAMLDAKIERKFDKLDDKVERRADKLDAKIVKLDEKVELKASKTDEKIGKLDDTSTSAILVIVRWGFGSAVVIILALIGMLWTAIGGPAAF